MTVALATCLLIGYAHAAQIDHSNNLQSLNYDVGLKLLGEIFQKVNESQPRFVPTNKIPKYFE